MQKKTSGISEVEKTLIDGLRGLKVDLDTILAIMLILKTEKNKKEMLRQMVCEMGPDIFWENKEKAMDEMIARSVMISKRKTLDVQTTH